jgi:hypothetical protein
VSIINSVRYEGEVKSQVTVAQMKGDFKKAKRAVRKWQLSVQEQEAWKKLSPFKKNFCGKVNTIGPLVGALNSVKELVEKFEAGNEQVADFSTNESAVEEFKRLKSLVLGGLDAKFEASEVDKWIANLNSDESITRRKTAGELQTIHQEFLFVKREEYIPTERAEKGIVAEGKLLVREGKDNIDDRVELNMLAAGVSAVVLLGSSIAGVAALCLKDK